MFDRSCTRYHCIFISFMRWNELRHELSSRRCSTLRILLCSTHNRPTWWKPPLYSRDATGSCNEVDICLYSCLYRTSLFHRRQETEIWYRSVEKGSSGHSTSCLLDYAFIIADYRIWNNGSQDIWNLRKISVDRFIRIAVIFYDLEATMSPSSVMSIIPIVRHAHVLYIYRD